MISLHVRYHAVLGLVLLAGIAPVASGQHAVGNGRALESTLQTTLPPTLQPRRSFSSELAFRESIVSGTAPAGLSFRGNALPSRYEFRGELGDDALFAYRRDSLYSGLAGRGIRGTDALQYQFALTVGSKVPGSLAGQISYARAGAAERSTDINNPLSRDLSGLNGGMHRANDPASMIAAIEAGSSLIQPVRSLSTYTANRGLQPTLVGVMQNRVTQLTSGQTASPLLGVQIVPVQTLRDPGALPSLLTTSVPDAESPTGEPAERGKTAYEQLIDRYRELMDAEEPDIAPGDTPTWASDLMGLQRVLRGLPSTTADITAPSTDPEPEPDSPIGRVDENRGPDQQTEPPTPTFDLEVLRRVREAGGMTNTLIPTDLLRIDRYTAYMQSAQDMIAKERYFDAEEVFISAMTSRPNDANAAVGRAHSQIGAGLFLSAGLNIRQLLIRHPEVSGMRYGPALLPSERRLEQVTLTLKSGLESPAAGADSGLLLAYLGFQRGIEGDMRAGLDALETKGDDADQRLVQMLRAVWLDAGDEGAEDSPADGG
jgi:hypothetical protein